MRNGVGLASLALILAIGPGCGGVAITPFAAAPVPVVSAPDTIQLGAFLSGVSGLDEADKETAAAAEADAAQSGTRKAWRGTKGSFGYVEPGQTATRGEGACRDFTSTVYVGGRPRSGKGTACQKGGEGAPWTIVS